MTRSMTRWTLAGCMALAALSAVAVLDVGSSTAEAAPSVSPFAGTYVGADPWGLRSSWAVTISDAGRITSSYSYSGGAKGSISGRISDDGNYSFTVSVTTPAYRDRRDPYSSYPRYTRSYESAGNMAPDAGGNIVGTDDAGPTFSWLRQ